MKRHNIIRYSLIGAAVAAALGFGGNIQADTEAATPPAATDRAAAPARLLTAEERERFRKEMQSAKTAEERQKVREQHRALIEQRAKEQGVTLPPLGMGPHGPGGGGYMRGEGHRYAQLLTPEERYAFHEQMRSAQSVEERQKIRGQHRAVIEQRAKEQGITLPEGRGPGGWQRGGPGGGGMGPGGPRN